MNTWMWVVIGVIAWVAAFLYKKQMRYKAYGLDTGRNFGNQIADAVGVEHNVFHSVLDVSAPAPSLHLLEGMRLKGVTPMNAAMDLSPFLIEGVDKLEAKFGPQRQLDHARAVFTRLLTLANDEAQRVDEASSSR